MNELEHGRVSIKLYFTEQAAGRLDLPMPLNCKVGGGDNFPNVRYFGVKIKEGELMQLTSDTACNSIIVDYNHLCPSRNICIPLIFTSVPPDRGARCLFSPISFLLWDLTP